MNDRIEVVIPTYQPDEKLIRILDLLGAQTASPARIHLINTGEAAFLRFLEKQGLTPEGFLSQYPALDLQHILPEDFDHGRTRTMGARLCQGADYCIMMTQDAVPEDAHLIENLLAPFAENADLAVSYARQLARPEAGRAEQYSRNFNYPDQTLFKSEADFDRLGIKTYFCSDVCAAYRLSVLSSLGYFPEPMIFNEDMVFAARALKAGYRICYAAKARVIHSHNYSAGQQFRRNFDLGVSQADHPEVFAGARSEGEGVRYVKAVLAYLMEHGAGLEVPGFIWECAARLLGYRLGKHYRRIPLPLVKMLTSNRNYWRK